MIVTPRLLFLQELMEPLTSLGLAFWAMPPTWHPVKRKLLTLSSTPYPVSYENCGVAWYIALVVVVVLDHMDVVATTVAGKGLNFKLREGYSAETSGNF